MREALSLAIAMRWLKARDGRCGLPAGNMLPTPCSGPTRNIQSAEATMWKKAKALLKEAGYPNGFSIRWARLLVARE